MHVSDKSLTSIGGATGSEDLSTLGREHGAALAQSLERLPVSTAALVGNEMEYVRQCLESSWISSCGEFVEAFEDRFATLCEVEHAVAVNTGTAALHLAL